jgi:EAL domain-containing protein (putative c-di-GMP-specific phosphodiesterase class I)
MSRALSLEVIAEGVETRSQADALIELGCRLAQGFYFSEAVPAREMSKLRRAGLMRVQRPSAA